MVDLKYVHALPDPPPIWWWDLCLRPSNLARPLSHKAGSQAVRPEAQLHEATWALPPSPRIRVLEAFSTP